jgi:hypothetical protein
MNTQFPFNIIELVLQKGEKYQFCSTCRHIAPYSLIYLIDDPMELIRSGQSIDYEDIWNAMVQRQLEGNLEPKHTEPICKVHAVQKLTMALGIQEPVIELIHILDNEKTIKSVAVCCELTHLKDEGNTWIGTSELTNIHEILKDLLERKEREGLH